MQDISLAAETGRTTGSAPARRLRTAGKIPGVLYGHGIAPQSLTVDGKALRTALNTEGGLNALISLEVNGERHLAMARQLQRHPVKGTVDHVDFVVVRRDEIVTAEVPVHLTGEAEQVNRDDGLVEQQLFSLVVKSTPGNIPPHLDVDISALTIGDAIRVGDLELPDGVSTELDPEEPIVVGQASRLAAELESVEEAAEEAAGGQAGEAGAAGAGEGERGANQAEEG